MTCDRIDISSIYKNVRLWRTVIEPLDRARDDLGYDAMLVLRQIAAHWPASVTERNLFRCDLPEQVSRDLERCLSVLAYRGFIVRFHVGNRRLVRAIPEAL